MLVNLIFVGIFIGLIIFIAKEEKGSIQKFFNQNRTPFKDSLAKVYNFWKNLFKSWVRILAVAIILVFQRDVWMMFITTALVLGVSYLVLRKSDVFQDNWDERKNKSADLIALAVALIWLFDKGFNLFTIIPAAVLIIVWLVFRIRAKKKNKIINITEFNSSDNNE